MRFRSSLLIAFLLLAATSLPALAEPSACLIAEGTQWETPYFVHTARGSNHGPTVLLLGGIHGNQTAGIQAAWQVSHWPVAAGRLVVIPEANRPGYAARSRYLPGVEKEMRNLNRNFPRAGEELEICDGELATTLWAFVQELQPDLILTIHESSGYRAADAGSGRSIVSSGEYADGLAELLVSSANREIEDAKKQYIPLTGHVNGSLLNAAWEFQHIPGLALITQSKDVRVSTRVAELRDLITTLLDELRMLPSDHNPYLFTDGRGDEVLQVAQYDGSGAAVTTNFALDKIAQRTGYHMQRVGPTDVRAGALEQFDLVIFPGGSGSAQARSLSKKGCDQVRKYVENGGGYIGICAGGYLASANYDWSLGIINSKTISSKYWRRGNGLVEIEFMPEANEVLGRDGGIVEVRYNCGPILSPASKSDLPGYVPLAYFRTEVANTKEIEGTMVNTPAVIAAHYGEGRVVVISPHPEVSNELSSIVASAMRWAANSRCRAAMFTFD